jgi:hypothetical protein
VAQTENERPSTASLDLRLDPISIPYVLMRSLLSKLTPVVPCRVLCEVGWLRYQAENIFAQIGTRTVGEFKPFLSSNPVDHKSEEAQQYNKLTANPEFHTCAKILVQEIQRVDFIVSTSIAAASKQKCTATTFLPHLSCEQARKSA